MYFNLGSFCKRRFSTTKCVKRVRSDFILYWRETYFNVCTYTAYSTVVFLVFKRFHEKDLCFQFNEPFETRLEFDVVKGFGGYKHLQI